MGVQEHEGERETRLVAVGEVPQVSQAMGGLDNMVTRVEVGLDELTSKLVPVLSESSTTGDDRAVERQRMSVPLAQSIAEQTERLAHLERRIGDLLQRLGV